MGIVWRNRPRAQLGSLPWHYTLDGIGAQIVAEHLGLELKAVGYREDRKRTLVDNPRLGYTRAVNGFFTHMHLHRTNDRQDRPDRRMARRGVVRPTLASAGSPRRVCADRRCQSVPRVRPRARPRNVEPRSALFFAFVYNALVFPIAAGVLYAATGLLLSPMIAAAAMAMSSPSVVTNANRLRGYRATGLPAEGETTDRVNVEVHEYEDGRRKRR